VRLADEVREHFSVTSKSAMTPSFIGDRDDVAGRAPEHLFFASLPTASILR
jgi:hypothetical protein